MESAAPLAAELALHLEFLRRMARALVRDQQVAEDVVQETLVAALARRPEPAVGLRPWLGSVLRRRVLLHFRTEQRRVAREALLERDARSSLAEGALSEAERALESFERSTILGQEVAALPELYRTVVLLRFYEGLPPQEIAKRLQRPIATIHTQLQRGLQQLRQKLDASYGGRREWVSALLPLALDGADGWWPSGIGGVGGVSHGAAAVALASLVAAGLGFWSPWSGRGPSNDAPGASLAGPPTRGAADGATETAAVDQLEVSPEISPGATARAAPSSESEAVSAVTPGTLRLSVSSRVGPVPGASVVAHTIADGESRVYQISSDLRGDEGLNLRLTFGGTFVDTHGPPEARRISGRTDRDGLVEIPVLDGAPWTVQVEADGLAPRSLSICATGARLDQAIELEVGSNLIVDRGSFPLECNIFATLRSPFDSRVHKVLLPLGKQQVEVRGLESGAYAIEGLTTGGADVALWSTEVSIERETDSRFDLSLGGTADLAVEVIDGAPAAPAHFVAVCGPLNALGSPLWARYAPVRSGFARFAALPPGPAVIKVLSQTSEIGREWVDIEAVGAEARAAVRIAKGELRIRRDPNRKGPTRFELARRSSRLGSQDGWIAMGGPLGDSGEEHYAGLADGSYRLWVLREGSARRFDLEVRGELVELDLSAGAEELASVRVERGPGAAPDAPIEIELVPRQWSEVTLLDGAIDLSPGIHRARTASTGLGHITRQIDVPNQDGLRFEAPVSARTIDVTCDPPWRATTVIVTPEGALAPPRRSRSLSLYFDREGRGRIDLHPGTYVLTDRAGKSASMTVEPALDSVFIRLP